ncbi:PQQ-binding-like beta-propeller repeat protein [Cellulomonas phragmiteti]|uniref:Pyrrolo-quinoline quinone repeat domain-containing protein n=1 Tax=Cellulomonas phragmiteti TaxID=478780 RepID=A0ABQ4DP97_9CELL|nr:PQQ-binding-like beta-propeller repeat protein [Cellulomonas phragmiteti]GIG41177.1 hypothetical protein Cph01nite_29390 [Cellulomonas phragmiteti]
MARRGPLHDVELVEDDEPDAPAPTAPDTHPPSRPRRRRAVAAAAALLVVVVGAAVVGQGVVDARERETVAAVARQPGGVDLLAGPPAMRWEASFDDLYLGAEVRAGDVLVGVQHASQGPVAVAGRDAGTGAEVWRTELVDGTTREQPAGTPEAHAWSGQCVGVTGEQHLVVCMAHDGSWVVADLQSVEVPPSTVRVVVLDVRDGSVVEDLTQALHVTDRPSAVAATGGVVAVAVAADAGAQVHAVRLDGTPAWELTVPGPRDEDGWGTFVTSVGELVALVTPTELRLLDATGRAVRTEQLDGRFVTGRPGIELYVVPSPMGYERGADGSRVEGARTTTTVVRPEGDVEVTGDIVVTQVDDGSVPGLVLTSGGGRLTAWDGEGAEVWSVEVAAPGAALLLAGRVHVDAGSEVLTLDARTGDELWRSSATTALPVTDGRHLLALAAAPQRGQRAELVALDPAGGGELWRGPLPDGTDEVRTHLRLLLAVELGSGEGGESYTVLG